MVTSRVSNFHTDFWQLRKHVLFIRRDTTARHQWFIDVKFLNMIKLLEVTDQKPVFLHMKVRTSRMWALEDVGKCKVWMEVSQAELIQGPRLGVSS